MSDELRIKRGSIYFDTDRAEVGHIYRVPHRSHPGNQRPHDLCAVLGRLLEEAKRNPLLPTIQDLEGTYPVHFVSRASNRGESHGEHHSLSPQETT